MARFFLFEATPLLVTTGVATAIRLAGGGRYAYDHRGFTDWRAGIVEGPSFSAAFGFSDDGWTGGAIPASSKIAFYPADIYLVSSIVSDYMWVGAAVEIRAGDDETAPGVYTLELVGTIAGVEASDGLITFSIADLARKLDEPLIKETFKGTGGLEGIVETDGRAKRRSFGVVRNVEGLLLDKPTNVYEFGDLAFPLNSFLSVSDKGRAGSMTVLAWQGSAAATLTALKAATPPQGGATVAPSIACVKWWTQPVGPLTADLQGQGGPQFIVNGDGSTTAGWTAGGGGTLSSVGGRLRVTNGSYGIAYQTFVTEAGRTYYLTTSSFSGTAPAQVTVGSTGAGSYDLYNDASVPAVGRTVTFVAAGASTTLSLYVNSGVAAQYAEFDDISVSLSPVYSEKAADIATRVVAAVTGPAFEAGVVATINAARAGVHGIHVDSTNENVASILDRLLLPSNVLWAVNSDGTIRLALVQLTASVEVLSAITVDRVESIKPARKVKLGYKRNHRTHSDAEISAAILVSDVDDFYIYMSGLGTNLLRDDQFGLFAGEATTPARAPNFTRVSGAADANYKVALRPFVAQLALGNNAATNKLTLDTQKAFVEVGRLYYMTMRVARSIGSTTTGATIGVTGSYKDSAGATISSFATTINVSTLAADGGFTSVIGSLAAPTNAQTLYWEATLSTNTGTGSIRVDAPILTEIEPGADVTTQINGPAAANVNYDNAGTTIEAAVDLIYTMTSGAGTLTTGTFTSSYKVTEGTVNGFNSNSGAQALTVTSGVATLTVSAMTTDLATVEVTMIRNGVTRKQNVVLTKIKAAAPPSGGGGGGFPQSQTSAFVQLITPWTTFANVLTDRIQITMPTGKTTARIVISLSGKWLVKNQAQFGPWNIEFKVQRNTGTSGSPVWTDIGATQNSDPDPYIDDLEGILISNTGTLSYTFDDTGRTAGVIYEYRVLTRISSGTTTSNTGGITYTGSVALSAP